MLPEQTFTPDFEISHHHALCTTATSTWLTTSLGGLTDCTTYDVTVAAGNSRRRAPNAPRSTPSPCTLPDSLRHRESSGDGAPIA